MLLHSRIHPLPKTAWLSKAPKTARQLTDGAKANPVEQFLPHSTGTILATVSGARIMDGQSESD